MFSKLFIFTVALAALANSSEAGEMEDIPQCAEKVSKKLAVLVMPDNVEAHAADVIKYMNRVEGPATENGDTENLPEIDRFGCTKHLEKFFYATSNIACHRHHWRLNWKQYDDALFATNEHTHRAVLGARMCINFLQNYIDDPMTSDIEKNLVSQTLVRVM